MGTMGFKKLMIRLGLKIGTECAVNAWRIVKKLINANPKTRSECLLRTMNVYDMGTEWHPASCHAYH